MGHSESKADKLPPVQDRDLRIMWSYNLDERHMDRLFNVFVEMDRDHNGVWTARELYSLVGEPRLSIRAPIIDWLFFMSDGKSEGHIGFNDFLVTFVSFCALSKEEILQLFFIVLDKDRNGHIEREELLDFFSYIPEGELRKKPVFPMNNKSALEYFRGGKWLSLEFDGLAQLCERFPYISYPAYHTQELFRQKLLGKKFWDRLDDYRNRYRGTNKTRILYDPIQKTKVEVMMPGICSMQELLEYSRRKTAVHAGKRVLSQSAEQESASEASSSITKAKDDQITRCPIVLLVRNPKCSYYLPTKPVEPVKAQYLSGRRPEFEAVDTFEVHGPDSSNRSGGRRKALGPPVPGLPAGVRMADGSSVWSEAPPPLSEKAESYSSSSSESEYSDAPPLALGNVPGPPPGAKAQAPLHANPLALPQPSQPALPPPPAGP